MFLENCVHRPGEVKYRHNECNEQDPYKGLLPQNGLNTTFLSGFQIIIINF